MLVSNESAEIMDRLSILIAQVNNNATEVVEIQTGVYVIGHFGGSQFMPDHEHHPRLLSICSYGVCDSIENLLEKEPVLEKSGRKFTVTLTPVARITEPPLGGWRWHKWGIYIGDQKPEHEYIHDDKHINLVYCYAIYEDIK